MPVSREFYMSPTHMQMAGMMLLSIMSRFFRAYFYYNSICFHDAASPILLPLNAGFQRLL